QVTRALDDRAVILGAAANALDFDDTHLPTVIHPGPPVAAALFALADERVFSGREMLLAYVLGVEAACRIGNAVSPGHYLHGWHITSSCGVFGAATAAAKVMRLDEGKVHCALALAATQASGLVEMLGSAARALNPGFAARNGIAAALLAGEGVQAPAEPLEGLRGFVNVFGGGNNWSAITNSGWEMERVAYKPYPSGVVLHSLIDACLELRTTKAPARVTITLHPLAIERGDRPNPRDGTEARLSAQHCAAVALIYGKAGVEQFTDAAVVDPEVRQLRERVTIKSDASLDKAACELDVDGRVKHAELRPTMSDVELEAKFRGLAGADAEPWLDWLDGLEAEPRVKLPLDLQRRRR
ncbi:MAG: MmgE/PrpD family protein, partial [Betaproteobacteria bacterium]|nr:MmgE/PrpD family protein [Betaproteobacteria bacterium]MBV9361286.1 MmgE/PrpD family protein [Betaproteobacteria bacterium]